MRNHHFSTAVSLAKLSLSAAACLAAALPITGCSSQDGTGGATGAGRALSAQLMGSTIQTAPAIASDAGWSGPVGVVSFDLKPNPKFAACLAQYPGDATRAPSVRVEIARGSLNDTLTLRGRFIKPDLAFDLFTVERSSLGADGTPNPAFTNFGLAWYQSDLEAGDDGEMHASIRTILLDQIFGFDPAAGLPPTGTFEMGFWFNDPNDATACGFDATKPTPFNGEHQAGPLAMISVPDAVTGLGPLCTKPDTSVSPARCSP